MIAIAVLQLPDSHWDGDWKDYLVERMSDTGANRVQVFDIDSFAADVRVNGLSSIVNCFLTED